MGKVPRPYEHSLDDVPKTLLKFVRGSNNSTRATVRVMRYPDGQLCVQLEDQISGGEMWVDADDLFDLGHVLVELAESIMEHGEG